MIDILAQHRVERKIALVLVIVLLLVLFGVRSILSRPSDGLPVQATVEAR